MQKLANFAVKAYLATTIITFMVVVGVVVLVRREE